jgi:hypothetical protein
MSRLSLTVSIHVIIHNQERNIAEAFEGVVG